MTKQAALETERFIHHALKYLVKTFPEETKDQGEEALKEKIVSAANFALHYGFETEADAMQIIDFLFRLPADFSKQEEYEWVIDILDSEDMDNEFKIESLHNAYAMFQAMLEDDEEES